jgi:hypothetical protein
MTASEAIAIIGEAIRTAEDADFAAEAEEVGVLRAQNNWQGHDNCVVYGTFAKALASLIEFDDVPTGSSQFNADEWDGDDEATNKREHLTESLASSSEIGTGEPIAYVGVETSFTLIRESATREEVEQAALDCLPADEG